MPDFAFIVNTRRFSQVSSLLLGLCLAVAGSIAAETSINDKFVALAASASVFDTDSLVYGHNPFRRDFPETPREKAEHEQFRWLVKNSERGEVEGLLKHQDSRVRLVALAVLFEKEGPHSLPAIEALAGDKSETIPMPGGIPQAVVIGKIREPIPTRQQTVGDAAGVLLGCYLKAAGGFFNPQGARQDSGFPGYWNKYGNLDHCLSWFAVDLKRAMRGCLPPGPECLPEILQVRKRIDQLPEGDRAWVLLGLRAEYEDFDEEFGSGYANMLASREELVQLLQKLGPDQVVAFLQRKQVTRDPDFQPDGDFHYQAAARLFIYKNAAKLLRPQDADALIAQGKLESGDSAIKNPRATGWWWIAASQVRKDQAEPILLEGYQTLLRSGHSDDDELQLLVKQMCRVNGGYFINVVSTWFFDPGDKPRRDRSGFVRSVAKIGQPSGRQVLANLLQHPQADRMRNPELAEFASAINSWVPKPVATPEEIKTLRGQTWKGGGISPQSVPGMLDRLRRSIPGWSAET